MVNLLRQKFHDIRVSLQWELQISKWKLPIAWLTKLDFRDGLRWLYLTNFVQKRGQTFLDHPPKIIMIKYIQMNRQRNIIFTFFNKGARSDTSELALIREEPCCWSSEGLYGVTICFGNWWYCKYTSCLDSFIIKINRKQSKIKHLKFFSKTC